MKHNEKIILFSALFGLIAVFAGTIGLYATFGRWLEREHTETMFSGWAGETGIIFCELLLSLIFTIGLAFVLWALQRLEFARGFLIMTGISRIGISLMMLGIFYSRGWYFILDPNGNSKYTYLVLVFGALQGVILLSARKN